MPKHIKYSENVQLSQSDQLFNKLYDIFEQNSTIQLQDFAKLCTMFITERNTLVLPLDSNLTIDEASAMLKTFDSELSKFKVKFNDILVHYPIIDSFMPPFSDYLDERNMGIMMQVVLDIMHDRFESGTLTDLV